MLQHELAVRSTRITVTGRVAIALSALVAAVVPLVAAPAAVADTTPVNPANPKTPETVSADALPTVQIDGVVWSQAVVGNVVYVGGNFTTARPAGSPPGVNTVSRTHLLAYNLQTGVLIDSFNHVLNGQVRAVTATPDGSRVYVGGEFTTIDGQSRNRLAAFDGAGNLSSWAPNMSHHVVAIAATNDKVWVGGSFTAVGATSRSGLAAFDAAGELLNWAPAAGGAGWPAALTVSPDGSRIVVGGSFTTMNGSSNPGYGLAALDAVTAVLQPFAVNSVVRNAGLEAGITSLTNDGQNVYGTGYVFGSGGNLEGAFSATLVGGSTRWIADCHGDHYSNASIGDVVYTASHAHFCGNFGGFPETNPKSWNRALALSKAATGVVAQDQLGYPNFQGNSAPSLLTWYPSVDTGTFTGMEQGPWSMAANSDYLVMGGEFRNVNGAPQQGLARFARRALATNLQRPRQGGDGWPISVSSPAAGLGRVTFLTNDDRDNENLTYRLFRDNFSTMVAETTTGGTFFRRNTISLLDPGATPGATTQYLVRAYDSFGNVNESNWAPVNIASSPPLSTYAATVAGDQPLHYWRLGESGTNAADFAGVTNATVGGSVNRNSSGALIGDPDTATTFNGGSAGSNSSEPAKEVFSMEAWISTGTSSGGKIIGFGNRNSGLSNVFDRHIYMDNAGHIVFGVYNGASNTIVSPGTYRNSDWHHVVATLGPDGMKLYVDAVPVAQRADVKWGQNPYTGFWRIGGDNLSGWSPSASSAYFSGKIDEPAAYNTVLTHLQVVDHWVASGRAAPSLPPTAAFTAAANGLTLSVDGSTSYDINGPITSYTWDFGDGGTAIGATAVHQYAAGGTYTVNLTVTDNSGSTGTMSQQVTVTGPAQQGPPPPGVPAPPGTTPVIVLPERLLDTRADGPQVGYQGDKPAAGATVELQITGVGQAQVPANAGAVVLNVTADAASADGYVTIWPCGTPRPLASNLNLVTGGTTPNLVIVKIGTDGKVCLFTQSGTHLIADITGYFPVGSSIASLVPERLLDTRADGPQVGYQGDKPAPGATVELQITGVGQAQVPANAGAVVLNVTADAASADGYVTIWPCGTPRPLASNLNLVTGGTTPNLVIVKIGTDGKVCLFTQSGTHLIADITGYFPVGSAIASLVPERLLDTRADGPQVGYQGDKPAPGATVELQITGVGQAQVPANAAAVVLNVTGTEAGADGYVTIWPCGTPRPLASNLNLVSGATRPNLVIVKIGTDGKVCLFTQSGTHLIADITGYFPASL